MLVLSSRKQSYQARITEGVHFFRSSSESHPDLQVNMEIIKVDCCVVNRKLSIFDLILIM